ncbi:hypothetical protein AKJ40_00865 [candidate division MSBL1 archaeon SCGC-AAA259M10]|uniref:HTH arsR-type domain-containing protein n=1 Tax=candidate division MSBL1 archaeon SCGC-AAA259M10 TaxID=1698270 RepID=A0A133V2L2_9EURY|nr:hypothetical protein AKJ40_00865 [candidate division MSBL1 archaeon SCGC-AAA259M10]
MTEEKGKVPLLKVLGVSPELRVLNALLDNPVFDLTAGEISDISGLKVAEVEEVLNKLRSWNIVEIKCEGEKKCYSLNTSGVSTLSWLGKGRKRDDILRTGYHRLKRTRKRCFREE